MQKINSTPIYLFKKKSFLILSLIEALERVEVGGKLPLFVIKKKTFNFWAKLFFSFSISCHTTKKKFGFFGFGPNVDCFHYAKLPSEKRVK